MGKSRSVRSVAGAVPARPAFKSSMPAVSADQMVGSVFARVINPAVATAPAPMGRM